MGSGAAAAEKATSGRCRGDSARGLILRQGWPGAADFERRRLALAEAVAGGAGIGAPLRDHGAYVFRQLAFEKHLFAGGGMCEADGLSV